MKKMQAKRSNRDKNERKAVIDSPAFLVYIGSDCFFFFGFFPSSTNHRFFEVVELVELADPVFKTLIIFTTICHCCFSSAFLL
jgi:hypothetical protein